VLAVFDFVLDVDSKVTMALFVDDKTEKGRFIHDIYQNIMKDPTNPPLVCDPLTVLPICHPELITGYYEVSGDV
jgi:hypothetical protein